MTGDLLLTIVMWAWPQSPSEVAGNVQRTAAMLDHITCEATVRRVGTARPEPITEAESRGTYLQVGDEVRCTSTKGHLTLMLYTHETKLITSKDGPYKILLANATQRTPAEAKAEKDRRETETLVAAALRYHGKRGATRGADSSQRVFCPGANGVVWPEHFVIRWRPELTSATVRVSIQLAGASEALWSASDVDGRRGSLDSSAVREALDKALGANPNNDPTFVLQFVDDRGASAISFYALRVDDARALKRELTMWNQEENELLRLVGRAYSFDVRKLFLEAAHEYKAALELANSCDLLNEAIAASQRAGDEEQVTQLIDRRSRFSGGCLDRHR